MRIKVYFIILLFIGAAFVNFAVNSSGVDATYDKDNSESMQDKPAELYDFAQFTDTSRPNNIQKKMTSGSEVMIPLSQLPKYYEQGNTDGLGLDVVGSSYPGESALWSAGYTISGDAGFVNTSSSALTLWAAKDPAPLVQIATFGTQSDGSYSYDMTGFVQGDIGDWNWEITHENQDDGDDLLNITCYVCAGTTDTGSFVLYETLTTSMTTTPSGTTDPDTDYTATFSIRDSLGSAPTPILGSISFAYDIDYVSGTLDASETHVTGATFDGAGDFTTTPENYNGQGGTADDTVRFTFTLDNTQMDNLQYYLISTADLTQTQDLIIDYSLTMTFGGTIDTVSIPDNNDVINNGRYFRLGQNITVEGDLTSTSTVDNIDVIITISGGGIDIASNGTFNLLSNSSGGFSAWIELNHTNFPNPWASTITIQAETTGQGTNPVESFSFFLAANVSSFTIDTVDPGSYGATLPGEYWQGNSYDFTVTGTVFDEFNVPAEGVDLTYYWTNQTSPGQIGSFTSVATGNDVSDASTGYFEFVHSGVLDVNLPYQFITFNLTIGENNVWYNSNGLNDSIFTIEYFHSTSITAGNLNTYLLLDFGNGTVLDLSTVASDIDILNLDFDALMGSGFLNISIRDQYGRIPYNLTIDPTLNSVIPAIFADLNVTVANGGDFIIQLNSLNETNIDTQIGTYGSTFQFDVVVGIGTSFTIAGETFSRTFVIYGPDNDAPELVDITSFTINGVDRDSYEHPEVASNVSIQIDINEIQLPLDNIRNVTIRYDITTTGGIIDFATAVASFTGVWTYANMTWSGGFFYFQFNFNDYGHGYWIKFEIIVYDLAGHGIDPNGDTYGGNLWTGGLPDYDPSQAPAGYNTSITNSFALDNSTTSYYLKLGDTAIPSFNFTQQILINGVALGNGVNITRIDQNITISIDLPQDPSGYQWVNITYRFMTFNASGTFYLDQTGSYIQTGPTYSGTMTFVGVVILGFDRYRFIIPSQQLVFGTFLDLQIEVTDNANNQVTTTPLVDGTGQPTQSFQITKVVDITPPTVDGDDFARVVLEINSIDDLDGNNNNNYRTVSNSTTVFIYINETSYLQNLTINYQVSDLLGSGIDSVIIYWYINGTLQSTFTEILVENGLTTGSVIVPVTETFNFTVAVPLALFQAAYAEGTETILSWEVEVIDTQGNLLTVNDNEAAQYDKYIISDFPLPPPPPPSVTETNDPLTGGTGAEGSNNALWIIAGFLGFIGLMTLYYQRHNIREIFERRKRRKRVEGILSDLTDEIRRLGAEGRYRRAILLTWEALERVSREILQAPRRYNQTAKEFASYLSTITIVDRDTLLTLSNSFEAARYGKDDPSRDDWGDAVKALEISVRTIQESGARTRITEDDEDW